MTNESKGKRAAAAAWMAGVLLAIAAAAGWPRTVRADTGLLREARMSDRLMERILGQIALVEGDMEESNVFEKGEIRRERAGRRRLDATRSNDLRATIVALERSVLDRERAGEHYAAARDGHKRVLVVLEEMAVGQAAQDWARLSGDTARRLRELRAAVEPLARKERDRVEATRKDLDRYAELAERAESAARDVEKTAAEKPLQAAAQALRNLNAVEAEKKLAEAADRVEKAMDQARGALAEWQKQVQTLDDLAKQLDGHIADAAAQEKKPDAEKAMSSIEKMEDTRQALESESLPKAAQQVASAQEKLAQNAPAEARNELQAARKEVAAKRDELAGQIEKAMKEQAERSADLNRMEAFADTLSDLMREHREKTEPVNGEEKGEKTEPGAGEEKGDADDPANLAERMSGLGEDMEENRLPKPGESMKEAAESARTGEHAQARQAMQEAQAALAASIQKARQELAQGEEAPSEPPTAADPTAAPEDGAQVYAGGDVTEKLGDERDGPSWRERMPERERQAALAARQETYSRDMNEPVRRYFERLARRR